MYVHRVSQYNKWISDDRLVETIAYIEEVDCDEVNYIPFLTYILCRYTAEDLRFKSQLFWEEEVADWKYYVLWSERDEEANTNNNGG